MLKLRRDLEMVLWGKAVKVPKGTLVHLVKNASSNEGDLYAISNIALLVELTGNSHDPKYRHAFVSSDEVEES